MKERGVGPADHVRVQHLEQRLEVALARGREEGVEDLALGVEIGVGDRGLALHASAGAARELARRLPKDKPDRLMRYFPARGGAHSGELGTAPSGLGCMQDQCLGARYLDIARPLPYVAG